MNPMIFPGEGYGVLQPLQGLGSFSINEGDLTRQGALLSVAHGGLEPTDDVINLSVSRLKGTIRIATRRWWRRSTLLATRLIIVTIITVILVAVFMAVLAVIVAVISIIVMPIRSAVAVIMPIRSAVAVVVATIVVSALVAPVPSVGLLGLLRLFRDSKSSL